MSNYTTEANYQEFVAVLATEMEAFAAVRPSDYRARINALYAGGMDEFAEKLTAGLLDGSAAHDGPSVKATCKALKIKPTRKAICAYLTGTFKVPA